MRLANAGYTFMAHTSTDGGSSYDDSYGEYHKDGTTDAYGLVVAAGIGSGGSTTGASGYFRLYSPLVSTTNTASISFLTINGTSAGSSGDYGGAFSGRNANEATNAIRFSAMYPSTNITSGEIAMYGIKKA